MNFFDWMLILFPFLYGISKAVCDIWRDKRFDSPLRGVFYDLGLQYYWDDVDGAGNENDAWHWADKVRSGIAFAYIFVVLLSDLPDLLVLHWTIYVLAYIAISVISAHIAMSTFLLLYHHIFEVNPYPAKLWFKHLVNPFEDWYKSERG